MDDLREPCPYRITDDCGGAFTMGCLGGAVFSAIKGFRIAPPGIKSRLLGMTTSVKVKAPVLGGNFGTWGLTFAACDCTLIYIRNKEDHWNSITAGAATGGILSLRSGPQAAVTSAIIGGVLLAMIEGISIGITRMGAEQFKPVMPTLPDAA
ncbi:hypothetical protein ACHWQZ_G012309 [Mnemiopsis leidyi]